MTTAYIPQWRRELEQEYPGFQAIKEMVRLYHGEIPLEVKDQISLLKEVARYTVTPPSDDSGAGAGGGVVVQLLVPGSTADAIKANVITQDEYDELEIEVERQEDLLSGV